MNVFELKTIIILAAISSGTFLMYLGYRLYALGIRESGDAELSLHPVKVRLSRFGPGVVLALFGAGLIVFGITRDFRATSDQNAIYEVETMNNVAAASGSVGNSVPASTAAQDKNAPQRNR